MQRFFKLDVQVSDREPASPDQIVCLVHCPILSKIANIIQFHSFDSLVLLRLEVDYLSVLIPFDNNSDAPPPPHTHTHIHTLLQTRVLE